MNKVLVTGLGVGYDFGLCESCHLDFSWLISNPSTLIWADKILITKNALEAHRNSTKENKFNKSVNIILDIALDNDLIEVIDGKAIFNKEESEEIYPEVKKDSSILLKKFDNEIKMGDEGVPNEIVINDYHYCGPYIGSIYGSMKLADRLNANCLFNKKDYTFLKYKYGMYNENIVRGDKLAAFNEIFKLYLPNELVLHNFAFIKDSECDNCKKTEICKDTYLHDIENNTKKILKWRDYDEILRAKEELEKIIDEKNLLVNVIDVEDIKKEYIQKQNKINKKIRKVFPAIKRWTNLTTVVATPIILLSAVTGNPAISIASSGMLGVAQATEQYLNYFENKNNWVGFINNINR